MGIKVQGGNDSTNLASVNLLNQLQVVTPQDLTGMCAGFVQLSSEIDAGTALGTRNVIPLESSDDYRLRVGLDQSLFNSSFQGGTNTLPNVWGRTVTSLSDLQQNGFYTLNATSLNTSGGFSHMRTWRYFPVFGTYPIYADLWLREGGHLAINGLSEFGFIWISSPSLQRVDDGVYFRRISGGALKGIISNSSVDIAEIDLPTINVPSRDGNGKYDPSEVNHYLVSFHNDVARFWINDVQVGEILCPSQVANLSAASSLPLTFRVYNIDTTSQPRSIGVAYVNVGSGDQNTNKPWGHAMSGMGGGAYQVQIGNAPGPTVTRTAAQTGHPASGTARATTAWSATSNPGTVNLGGLWNSTVLGSLSSDVDYPLFAYLNPAGTFAVAGKNLYVTGVRIGDTGIVAAPGSTGAFFSYIVQVENSAVATSTADSATTTSGKATVIGGQGFAPSEAAGTFKPGFDMTFNPPLVVPPNKYFTVVARPFGTFTGGLLTVTGSVAVNGYWE